MGFGEAGLAGLISPELASQAASFPGMIDELRGLQNRITGAAPSDELAVEVSRTLTDLAIRLDAHAVGEAGQIAGRMDLPGRAQALVPVVHLDEQDEQHGAGRVTFGRFYLGGNGAAHGGAIPLIFDEVMGRLSNTGGRPLSRTASLHVNYRGITPIERELQLTARFDRRKAANGSCPANCAMAARCVPTWRASSSRSGRASPDRFTASRTACARECGRPARPAPRPAARRLNGVTAPHQDGWRAGRDVRSRRRPGHGRR